MKSNLSKFFKKAIAVALAFAMICTLVPAVTETAEAKKATVVKIYTYEDLEKVNKKPGKSYKLMKDLKLEPGQVFEPLCSSTGFYGVFDGNKHSIEISYATPYNYAGLFVAITGGTVKNLTVTGTVSGKEFVGGIAGYANGCKIANCLNKSDVTGESRVGGLVGRFETGKIYNCLNAGKITCSGNCCGGIAGEIYQTNGSILNCANIGAIYGGTGYTGGIVGEADQGNVKNCVNSFKITSVSGSIGGIMGNTEYRGKVENNYFYKDESTNTYLLANGKSSTTFDANLKLKKSIKVNGKKYTNVVSALNAWAEYKTTSSQKFKSFTNDKVLVKVRTK